MRAISPTASEKTLTDKNGFFTFISLPPDFYSVSAERSNGDAFASSIRVDSDQTTFMVLRYGFRCGGTGAPAMRADPFLAVDERKAQMYPAGILSSIPLPALPPLQPEPPISRCL